MSTNITALPGVNGEPDEGIVKTLEDLLASAKKGEVHGLAVAYTHQGNQVTTDWAGGGALFDGHRLNSAVTLLQFCLCKTLDESCAEDEG